MSDPLTPAPRDIRAPGNVSNLQSRITRYAREHGISVARLNQRILTEVTFGMLGRAQALGIIPLYLAKGGMALELRFGLRARASMDLDIGMLTSGEALLTSFDRALAVGFHDFIFIRSDDVKRLEQTNTYRLKIRILYRGRAFGTLDIDLNEANHETAVTYEATSLLTTLGLPGPLQVPLLDPYVQIAHKLHGATEPDRSDYINFRHRDVVDVLLMSQADNWEIDYAHLRKIAVTEFQRRKMHNTWPPTFTLRQSWEESLARDAERIELESSDPQALTQAFTDFIQKIDRAQED